MKLVHLNKLGKMLYRSAPYQSVKAFDMLSQSEVVIVDNKNNKVDILNLVTKKIRSKMVNFLCQEPNMFIFQSSRLLAFCSKARGVVYYNADQDEYD